MQTAYQNSFLMSQNAYILGSIAKTKFLMLFKKTTVMYCENHTKDRNAVCWGGKQGDLKF